MTKEYILSGVGLAKVMVSTFNFNSLESFLASLPTKIISESGKGNFIFSFVFMSFGVERELYKLL